MDLDEVILRLRKLEEVEKIKELRGYRFPSAGDPEMDVEAALRLFTEDGVVEYTGIGSASGHAELRAFFEVDPVNGRFHIFAPGKIRVADDLVTGTGSWFMLETAKAPSSKTGRMEPVWVQATYEDEYAKVDDEWKLKYYKCDMRMFCTHQDGWGETAVDLDTFFKSSFSPE